MRTAMPTLPVLRRSRLVISMFAAASVILASVDAYGWWLTHRADQTERARPAVLEAARKQVAAMLSYHAGSVDKDLAAASEGLAEPFRTEFVNLSRTVIEPTARERQVSTHTSVSEAAILEALPDHAEVLLFLNQSTRSGNGRPPTLSADMVRATLARVDGAWKVTDLEPL